MTCPLGDPFLSLYTPKKKGYKQNSLFGTITISSTTFNLMIYVLILWVGSPQMVQPMYHLVVLGIYTPTAVDLDGLAKEIPDPKRHAGNFEPVEDVKPVPLDPTSSDGKVLKVSATLDPK
jgi:hypothetical protein